MSKKCTHAVVHAKYALRLALVMLASVLLALVAGCGGTNPDSNNSNAPVPSSSPEIAAARDAVDEAVTLSSTIDAGADIRQTLEDRIDSNNKRIVIQRELLEDIRRIAPATDGSVGETFSDGPCYDGTLPRAEVSDMLGSQGDAKTAETYITKIESVENKANRALELLNALGSGDRRKAASVQDENATVAVRQRAITERRKLVTALETLESEYPGLQAENEALKDEARELRRDAGCAMG